MFEQAIADCRAVPALQLTKPLDLPFLFRATHREDLSNLFLLIRPLAIGLLLDLSLSSIDVANGAYISWVHEGAAESQTPDSLTELEERGIGMMAQVCRTYPDKNFDKNLWHNGKHLPETLSEHAIGHHEGVGEAKHKDPKRAQRAANNKDTLPQLAAKLNVFEAFRQWKAQVRETDTLLIWAAGAGRLDIMRYVLERGVRPDPLKLPRCGTLSPLAEACKHNRQRAVDLLLEWKAQPAGTRTKAHAPPLIVAAQYNSYDAVAALLAAAPDDAARSCMLEREWRRLTAAEWARKQGYERIVRLLVAHGAAAPTNEREPLETSSDDNSSDDDGDDDAVLPESGRKSVNRLRKHLASFKPPPALLHGAPRLELRFGDLHGRRGEFPPVLHGLEKAVLRTYPALREAASGRCIVREVTLMPGIALRSGRSSVQLRAARTADGSLFDTSKRAPHFVEVRVQADAYGASEGYFAEVLQPFELQLPDEDGGRGQLVEAALVRTLVGLPGLSHGPDELGFRRFIYETDPTDPAHGPRCEVVDLKQIRWRACLTPMMGANGTCRTHHGAPIPRAVRSDGADVWILSHDLYKRVASG